MSATPSSEKSATEAPVIISGASGRMGRTLVTLARASSEVHLAGAVEAPGHPDLGKDAGALVGGQPCGVTIADSLAAATDAWRGQASSLGGPAKVSPIVIEFSSPEASLAHLREAAELGLGMVLGTTGFNPAQLAELAELTKRVPCLRAANMSVGVTVLAEVVEQVARRLGSAFDIEVVEMHHRLKKDAPSGTALALAEAAARGREADLSRWATYGREGITGERPREQMAILALRGGDVVGDHTVYFAGTGERIELTHRAQSREAFASGALRAAAWLAGRPAGQYSMRDALGL